MACDGRRFDGGGLAACAWRRRLVEQRFDVALREYLAAVVRGRGLGFGLGGLGGRHGAFEQLLDLVLLDDVGRVGAAACGGAGALAAPALACFKSSSISSWPTCFDSSDIGIHSCRRHGGKRALTVAPGPRSGACAARPRHCSTTEKSLKMTACRRGLPSVWLVVSKIRLRIKPNPASVRSVMSAPRISEMTWSRRRCLLHLDKLRELSLVFLSYHAE